MDKTASRQEFIKVMHWLAEHPVEKDSLEYFIPLAYYNAFMNRDMEQAVNHINADALEMMWERLGPEGFFHNFRKRLGEEIVRREQTEENDVLEGE